MNSQAFFENCNRLYSSLESNYIPEDKALSEELILVKMFDEPLIGTAACGDPRFSELRKEEVIGEHLLLPEDWLLNAKTVVSFFFPYTETIRDSNKADKRLPSKGWLNGRIEGQQFINQFTKAVADYLSENGFASVAPSIDRRFFSNTGIGNHGIGRLYTSNWSERHAAYICGLGTFGLSKGLITEKGIAGRITSVITELEITPSVASFESYDENCILCGDCIEKCPVGAISFEHGKDHAICSSFLDEVKAEHSPWYGCGKCQVGVSCEFCNPSKE